MAKKKKGKTIQMLSPEKYIKTKARSLPIHECWINAEWKESKMATIIISRKHTNGNITFGIYLVDLHCLGVKDTYFKFNITETEYNDFLFNMRENKGDLQKVDYNLAHNIIYSALEFADDYGFEPVKEFTSIMQYFLEEDTDEIELIEIECGNNHKPLYLQGPNENNAKANQIIAQLEHTAGPGNFDYVLVGDEEIIDENEGDWEDEDRNVEVNSPKEKFDGMSDNEKLNAIESLTEKLDELSRKEYEEFEYLTNTLFNNYVDIDRCTSISNELVFKLEKIEIVEEYPDELLALDPNSKIDRDYFIKKINNAYATLNHNPKKAEKKIRKLQNKIPDNPMVAFLDLSLLQTLKSDKLKEKLKFYHELYPNHPLIKMLWDTSGVSGKTRTNAEDLYLRGPENYFSERNTLHRIEILNYLLTLFLSAIADRNATLLESLNWTIIEAPVFSADHLYFFKMILLSKAQYLLKLKQKPNAN